MTVASAKAKLDAQAGDPATGFVSRQDHKDSYDELVDDTALTGTTTAEALTVSGAVSAAALAGSLLTATTPGMDGTAAAGSATVPARADHVHPTDTGRAPLGGYRIRPGVAGAYVTTKGISGVTTVTATQSLAVYTPIVLDAGTLDRIGAEVTTGASATTVRLGIYTNDAATGLPASLLLDAGTIDASSTGVKEITISHTIATTGVYWLVAVAQGGTPGLRTCGVPARQWLAATAADAAGTVAASGFIVARTQTAVTGALPASATVTSGTATGASAPTVIARYA